MARTGIELLPHACRIVEVAPRARLFGGGAPEPPRVTAFREIPYSAGRSRGAHRRAAPGLEGDRAPRVGRRVGPPQYPSGVPAAASGACRPGGGGAQGSAHRSRRPARAAAGRRGRRRGAPRRAAPDRICRRRRRRAARAAPAARRCRRPRRIGHDARPRARPGRQPAEGAAPRRGGRRAVGERAVDRHHGGSWRRRAVRARVAVGRPDRLSGRGAGSCGPGGLRHANRGRVPALARLPAPEPERGGQPRVRMRRPRRPPVPDRAARERAGTRRGDARRRRGPRSVETARAVRQPPLPAWRVADRAGARGGRQAAARAAQPGPAVRRPAVCAGAAHRRRSGRGRPRHGGGLGRHGLSLVGRHGAAGTPEADHRRARAGAAATERRTAPRGCRRRQGGRAGRLHVAGPAPLQGHGSAQPGGAIRGRHLFVARGPLGGLLASGHRRPGRRDRRRRRARRVQPFPRSARGLAASRPSGIASLDSRAKLGPGRRGRRNRGRDPARRACAACPGRRDPARRAFRPGVHRGGARWPPLSHSPAAAVWQPRGWQQSGGRPAADRRGSRRPGRHGAPDIRRDGGVAPGRQPASLVEFTLRYEVPR